LIKRNKFKKEDVLVEEHQDYNTQRNTIITHNYDKVNKQKYITFEQAETEDENED
jgi:hypothetical protein